MVNLWHYIYIIIIIIILKSKLNTTENQKLNKGIHADFLSKFKQYKILKKLIIIDKY